MIRGQLGGSDKITHRTAPRRYSADCTRRAVPCRAACTQFMDPLKRRLRVRRDGVGQYI